MPRSVLRLAYKDVPAPSSAAFPTSSVVYIPLLEVAFEYKGDRFPTLGLVDSGATYTYAPTEVADALGIDWKNCPDCPVHGVGGSGMGYAADVSLIVLRANHRWSAKVVFTRGMNRIGIVLW